MGRFGHVFDRSDESDIRWVAENRLEARVCSGWVTGRLWAKNTERARALLGLFLFAFTRWRDIERSPQSGWSFKNDDPSLIERIRVVQQQQ